MSQKDKQASALQLSNSSLKYYPREIKRHVCKDNHTRMFIAALFIIAPNWKQPRCPSAGQRAITLQWIPTTEYYPAIKNEGRIQSNVENLKNIRLIQRNWVRKSLYCIIDLYEIHAWAKLIYNDRTQKSKVAFLWQWNNWLESVSKEVLGADENGLYFALNDGCVSEYNWQNTSSWTPKTCTWYCVKIRPQGF